MRAIPPYLEVLFFCCGEGFVKDREHEISIGLRDAHGGFNTQDISKEAPFSDEQATFPSLLQDLGDEIPVRLFALSIFYGFYADHQTHTANFPDGLVFFLKLTKPGQQAVTHHGAALLKVVPSNNFQGGPPLGNRNGVPPVGVEVDPLREGFSDLVSSDNSGEWRSVPDALGHDHDIGLDALVLESPEGLAGAAESRLHFVGDAYSTRCADMFVGFR